MFRNQREQEMREDYLLKFIPREQDAYKEVQLLIAAVGKIKSKTTSRFTLTAPTLHRCFIAYAKKMNLKGYLFGHHHGRCPAVTMYSRDDQESVERYPPIYCAVSFYKAYPERLDQHPKLELILEAAQDFLDHFESGRKAITTTPE